MGATAPVSKWIPSDDLLLKNAVESGATMEFLSKGPVRFSQKYTIQELQDRWLSLLYDPIVSVETSALMFEYERFSLKTQAKSSKSDGIKDTKSILRKRKAESIRSHYYSMRKMMSNVSQAVGPLDVNYLGEPGLTNFENRDEPPFADYILPDSCHRCPDSTFEVATHAYPDIIGGALPATANDVTGTPSIFVSDDLSLDPGDLDHSTLLPLAGNNLSTRDHCMTENYGQLNDMQVPDLLKSPLSHTMEVISTPILPDVDYGGKEDYINDTFRSSHDIDNPDRLGSSVVHPIDNLNEQIPSLGPETETAGIIAQLNQFMDCPDPDDLPDSIDEFYIDALSNLLADYPNEHEGEIACPSLTLIATEEYTDLASGEMVGESLDKNFDHCSIDRGIIYCPEEKEKLLSSALSVNPGFPELRNGVICCKLNTEDHVVPDNDDVFLPVCMPTLPLSCLADWELDKARNPVSSSIMDIPTHQRASRGGILMMKRERSDNENPVLSSHRMISSFPTHQKVKNDGALMIKREQLGNERTNISSHIISSSLENHDKTTHGGAPMMEREQINSNRAQIMSSSLPTSQNITQRAMLLVKREESANNQTNISSHIKNSSLQPVVNLNHAVSVHDGNAKLKHIDPRCDSLITVNENNLINQLKCTNENENDTGGLYIKEKVIHVNQTENQNNHPLGSSLDSRVISPNHIHGSSSIDVKPQNENSDVLHNKVFLQELDTTEMLAAEIEKDLEIWSDEECPDDDEDVPYSSDVEAMILDMDFSPNDEDDDLSETVLRHPDENLIRTMIRLEQAARASSHRMMQVYGAFAVLYSHHSTHLIKKPEVLLGRNAEDFQVDIDLSTERCRNKVSRRQAIIKVTDNESFSLKNLGKSSIYINGREVAPKQSQYLTSSCLIEVRSAAFLFEANPARVKRYIEEIRRGSKVPKQEPFTLE